MIYPNLFILGAPKCGTTAMVQWLSAHPDVFVPQVKEPHFFTTEYQLTKDPVSYLDLYSAWADTEKWALDASVWSLFSPNAIREIRKVRPDSKFVVMLRNPLDMIPSMHRHQIYNGNELELDLPAALELNAQRKSGQGISVLQGYPADYLAYYHSCALGRQVQTLLSHISRDDVHFILHDDLKQAPAEVMRKLLDFLDIAEVFPGSYDRVNVATIRVFPALDRAAKSVGQWKQERGIKMRFGFLSWLRRVNKAEKAIPKMPADLRRTIAQAMHADVNLLGSCIDRDLSYWLGRSSQ